MNISILGAMPWQEVEKSRFIASDFMARIWGPRTGALVTVMMLWTAFASVFSLLLGYSRVPYAAALEGDYFKVFARVHPKHHFPHVSLLWLGGAAAVFCLFKLADVVTALVVIRISIAVPGADARHHRAASPRARSAAAVPDVALSGSGACSRSSASSTSIVMRPKSLESIRLAMLVVIVGTVLFCGATAAFRELTLSRAAVRGSIRRIQRLGIR